MGLNQTLQECTPMMIEKAKAFTSSLTILGVLIILVIPIIFLMLSTKKTSWGRFWIAWAFIVVAAGILLISVNAFPTVINNFIEFMKSLFA